MEGDDVDMAAAESTEAVTLATFVVVFLHFYF